jgi:N-acyl-D-aspartate/D-glutamate deacylase
MRDPDRRERILAEYSSHTPRLASDLGALFTLGEPANYQLHIDDSLGARALAAGVGLADFVYDKLLDMDGRSLLYWPSNNFARHDYSDLTEMVTSENVLFGLSDAGAHCGSLCDASMPTTSLTEWARDRSFGKPLPIEWIVHRLTQRNASHMGWWDRGVVAEGYTADLNVIDFDNLKTHHPHLAYDLPTGGRRLVQKAEGYRTTIKSGQVTFVDGEHTGVLPGHLLRGQQRVA